MRTAMKSPVLAIAAIAATIAFSPATHAVAQPDHTVVADGLNGPMGVFVAPDQSVWVVDSGTGGETEMVIMDPVAMTMTTGRVGNTSRIIRVDQNGTNVAYQTLSMMVDSMQVYGGGRLALLDGVMYATVGAWGEANPGERPPLAASVVTFADGQGVEVANVWALEEQQNPDGMPLETNPFGLTAGPDGMLWIADAAGNSLLKFDTRSQSLEVVAVFDNVDSPIPSEKHGGALKTDPVPTAIAFDSDGIAYVSLLAGFPLVPGSSKVVTVDADGIVRDYAVNLTMLTDLRYGPDGMLYGVSFGRFTDQGPELNSGAVVRILGNGGFEEVASELSFPTSIDFNEAGDAFVTINGSGPFGAGQLWRIDGVAARM